MGVVDSGGCIYATRQGTAMFGCSQPPKPVPMPPSNHWECNHVSFSASSPQSIMVQRSCCTISPSQRRTSVLMCKSSAQALHGRRLANDSQYHISRKFYLQTPPNRRPKKLRSDELPTGRIGLALRAPNRNLSRFEPSGITQVNRDKCEHRGTK